MKRTLGKYLLVGGMLVLATPATILAQKASKPAKEKGEVQQIIITRSGDQKEKTIIEINGDKVTVNGKDVKDLKDEEINIDINRLKDVDALVVGPRPPRAPGAPRAMNIPRNFNFNFDDGDFRGMMGEDSSRAMLGVVTAEDEKGARVNQVSKESGAEKAGIKTGDIITRIGDAKIEDADDVAEQVRKHKPGDKVAITYLRDGKEQKATAELTRWKGLRVNAENFRVMVPGQVTPFGPNGRFNLEDFEMDFNRGGGDRPKLGVSVQDSEDGKGVVVKEVEDDSNAAKAGIKEGDIITRFNETDINDVAVLRREMAANRDKASVKVQLLRGGKQQTIDVKMPRKLKTADL